MTALCLCVARKMSSASPTRACMSASIASLSFVVASSSIRSFRCFHVSSRFSPVPSLALRIGSNDQRDGSQCCPSFGGCPRDHPGVEPAAQCASTRENSPGSDSLQGLTDSQLFLDSTGGAAWPFSVGRVICLVSSVSKD